MKTTRGQLEAEICEAVIKFEKEYMGRGPLEAKAYVLDDMVLVRLKQVLTQAELKLAEATDRRDGRELIKRVRITLLEQGRPLLESSVKRDAAFLFKEARRAVLKIGAHNRFPQGMKTT